MAHTASAPIPVPALSSSYSRNMGPVSWNDMFAFDIAPRSPLFSSLHPSMGPIGSEDSCSPNLHAPMEHRPLLERDFFTDFACCGQVLPDMHELLTHYEETHVVVVDPHAQPTTSLPSPEQHQKCKSPQTHFPWLPQDIPGLLASSPSSPLSPSPPANPFIHEHPLQYPPSPELAFYSSADLIAQPPPPPPPSPSMSAIQDWRESDSPPPLLTSSRSRGSSSSGTGSDEEDQVMDYEPFDLEAIRYGVSRATYAKLKEMKQQAIGPIRNTGYVSPTPYQSRCKLIPRHGMGKSSSIGKSSKDKRDRSKKGTSGKLATFVSDSGLTARDSISSCSSDDSLSLKNSKRDRERGYKCPKPGCVKSYLNPNGLKYHLHKGTCSFTADVGKA